MTQEHEDFVHPDDRLMGPILRSSRSVLFFRELLTEISEESDEVKANAAQNLSAAIEAGEIGIVCADGVRYDGLGEKVVITQLRLGDRNIPTFIVPFTLNTHDLMADIEKHALGGQPLPLGLDSNNTRKRMKKSVLEAIDEMTFALEARERFSGANGS